MAFVEYLSEGSQGWSYNDKQKGALPYRLSLELVDPARARHLLSKMATNRNPSAAVVDKYADMMMHDQWGLSDSMLCISTEGKLMNGQQRLLAIIKSGTTQTFAFAYNLPPEAMMYIDTLRPRTVGNIFKIMGKRNPNDLAVLVNAINIFEKTGGFTANTKLAGLQMNKIIERYGEDLLYAAINGVEPVYRRFRLGRGIWSTLWIQFGDIDMVDRDYFFARLADGNNLSVGNPIYTLREILIKGIEASHPSIRYHKQAGLTILAWNKFRQQEYCKLLRFNPDSDLPVAI